jgi:hypothetical protein
MRVARGVSIDLRNVFGVAARPGKPGLAVAVVVAIAAAGCASDPTTCAMPDFTANAPATATAGEVAAVLKQSCALGGCHLSLPGAGGLVLEVGGSEWENALVGVPALENPAMDLVAPGDPDGSWVVHKIFGDVCATTCDPQTGCGAEMPFGASLSPADRGTIVAWIAAGAGSD